MLTDGTVAEPVADAEPEADEEDVVDELDEDEQAAAVRASAASQPP